MKWQHISRLSVCLLLLVMGGVTMCEQNRSGSDLFPFVLPWDDASESMTNVSGWLNKPAGKNGFVVVKDGHLDAGGKRIRFFGVNLCFGACFPQKADAEKVAARMAKFGINCVRFHHADNRTAPDGIFKPDMRTLDPAQLDKLDYLIAQLKKHGIYADLNLHVSRTYPGLPTWEGMPSYHKGVDNFEPRMMELQREYARDLLTHVNPYTQTRYADEPAIAFIEINNENALFHEWWGGGLDGMPDAYANELGRQWNEWLKKKYASGDALKQAWGAKEEPLGTEMLTNADFTQGAQGWTLEQHEGAKAAAQTTNDGPDGKPALRLQVEVLGKESWHVQLNQSKLRLLEGKPYTLTFWAKADAPRRIGVNAMQAHDPWRQFWSADVRLTTEWKQFRFVFAPNESDGNGRVGFSNLGAQVGTFWFANVSLKPGGVLGLRQGEGLGSISIFRKSDFNSRTAEAQRDWVRFLWETEERYWMGMSRFIKDDLKAHGLVIGTQMGYSPFPIQAQLDVVDVHSYWQHPRFPGRPWDPENWFVNNVSMAGAPNGGNIPSLALQRVTGKPYICTEYNHSAPNTYSSEAFLLLSAYAAMQDWDGIFAFSYCHRRDDWNPQRIPNFFDIDAHPTKMATLPAAVAMFARGDVPTSRTYADVVILPNRALERVRQAGPRLGADVEGMEREAAVQFAVGVTSSGLVGIVGPPGAPKGPPLPAAIVSENGALTWDTGSGRGVVTVNAPRSKTVIGFSGGRVFDLGGVIIAPQQTRQNGWSAITLTVMEGSDFKSPLRILITATGYAENTEMGWKNAEKSTVGRDWGKPPSLVEGIPATITLPVAANRVRAWALDERGQRKGAVAVRDVGGKAAVEIGAAHKTLWYEVVVE